MIKLGKILKKIKSKKGNEITIRMVKWEDLDQLLSMFNELSKENTFLTFKGEKITRNTGIDWLSNVISEIERKNKAFICAFMRNKLTGICWVTRGESRNEHTGILATAVRKNFRDEGIGKELLKTILEESRKLGLKVVYLGVFASNKKAISLYQNLGFQECGRMPKEVFYKNRYIDGVRMYKEI